MSIAVVACGLLTVTLWVVERNGNPFRNPVTLAAFAWLVALLLSAGWGLDPHSSFRRIGKGMFPALTALGAYHALSSHHRRRAVRWLLVSAALAWIFGLATFAAHGADGTARARGPVGHYMTFAGQLGLLVSLAAGIAFVARGWWRWGGAAVAVLGTGTMVLTFTRSAWLGLGASLTIILALHRPRAWFALAAAAILAFGLAPARYRERVESIVDPHHPTNVERTHMWSAGLRMFRDHPWTGVGLQDLKPIYDRYRSPAARERVGHLHSVPIQIAATMGIVGLVAFTFLYRGLLVCAGRDLRRSLTRARAHGGVAALDAGLRLGVLGGLVGFVVAGLFEWNWGDEELLHPLFLLAGMAWAARPAPLGTVEEQAAPTTALTGAADAPPPEQA